MFGIGCDLTHISTLAKEVTTRGTDIVEATDTAEAKQGLESKVKVRFFPLGSEFPQTTSSCSGTELK